jgi:hypothetical protein
VTCHPGNEPRGPDLSAASTNGESRIRPHKFGGAILLLRFDCFFFFDSSLARSSDIIWQKLPLPSLRSIRGKAFFPSEERTRKTKRERFYRRHQSSPREAITYLVACEKPEVMCRDAIRGCKGPVRLVIDLDSCSSRQLGKRANGGGRHCPRYPVCSSTPQPCAPRMRRFRNSDVCLPSDEGG